MSQGIPIKSSEVRLRLLKLCKSVAALQRKYQRDWISSREIAKYQEGSEELAPMIESSFSLPGADEYLAIALDGRRVTLTEEGHAFLRSPQVSAQAAKGSVPQQVADAVKEYAREIRLLRFDIRAIHTIGKSAERYVHSIQVDVGDQLLPNESPAHVISESLGRRIHGRIVGQDAQQGILYVALESHVSAGDLPARLEIDRAFLLYHLADSLSRLEEIPERGRALLGQRQRAVFTIHDDDSVRVADQLVRLQPPWTHFLWGPPGAGKTYGMARLILRLLQDDPDQRILLVAPSNVAVDVALQKVVEQAEGSALAHLITNRRILRYGYPQKTEILSRPELLGSSAQQELSHEIGRKERELRKAKNADRPEEVLSILRADLLDLQEKLKGMVRSHVDSCRVVATTTTMAYMRGGPIANQQWDTILVDEVTMVPPAVCLYLSSLAGGRLLFAGDPRQLGPIYEGRRQETETDQRWMGQDVYDFTGLASGSGERRDIQTQDPRLVRITSQRRCTRAIWQPIHHLYEGVNSAVDENALLKLHALPPYCGRALSLIDTGRQLPHAVCERHRKSWHNHETAAYAVSLAKEIVDEHDPEDPQPSIAIITPYRAQYRLIQQALKEIDLHHQVEVGTIHRFQGSEADVVIFDMVDGPGREKLGALLKGDKGLRLVNVAISRARGKLVVLANKSWCRSVMNRSDNPLLWDLVMQRRRPTLVQVPRDDVPEVVVPLVEPVYPDPPVVETAEPVRTAEQIILTEANITPEKILSLVPAQTALIADKRAKQVLNVTLNEMDCKMTYDGSEKASIWRGPDGQFRVDHGTDTLTRQS